MKWTVPAVLILALVLISSPAGADTAKQFQPAFDLISISNSNPSANANVVHKHSVAQTDHVIGKLKYTLPAGWDIARAQSGQNEPVVGTGTLRVDVGPPALPACDGVMEVYALRFVDQGPDPGIPGAETIWVMQGDTLGYPLPQIQFPVKNVAGAQTLEAQMFDVGPQVCAMTTMDLTFCGRANLAPPAPPAVPPCGSGSDPVVLTNPSSAGVKKWDIEYKSFPLGEPSAHTVTRCDEVGIGATAVDTDSDGIADGCDNCLSTANADQRDFDADGLGDVCDGDVDGDGVLNASDQCAFTPLGQTVDVNGCSQVQVDLDLDGKCDPGKVSTLCTGSDNCPTAYNPTQANVVHPLTPDGDDCEDPDADGWMDSLDNCPDHYDPFLTDGDLDGRGDLCDTPCPADPDCDDDNVSDGPLDPDGGGAIVAGPDNCTTTPNTNQANADGDSRGDVCDNCPSVANSDQLNIDGDSFGDACDAGDFDVDEFSDRVEYAAGTDRGAKCGVNAWPPDINNSGFSDISDVVFLTANFGFAVPAQAPARYNIAPDPVDGFVDITDVSRMTALFGLPCPP